MGKKNNGFTLIETLMVIVILGMLIMIAVPLQDTSIVLKQVKKIEMKG